MSNTLSTVFLPFFLLATSIASTAASAELPVSRPDESGPSRFVLCSSSQPVCVHADSHAQRVQSLLQDLEWVARTLTVLGWRRPEPDWGLGGNNAFDLYVLPDRATLPHLHAWARAYPDPDFAYVGRRGNSAWGALRDGLRDTCSQRAAVAEVYFRAVLYGMDALGDDQLAIASSAYVGSVVSPCSLAYLDSVSYFQSHPHLGVVSSDLNDPRGALLLPWFLETRRSSTGPLELLRALWTLAEDHQSGLPGESREHGIDLLGVVPMTEPEKTISVGETWLQFSVARALWGATEDGAIAAGGVDVGRESEGAVRIDWNIPYRTLPRRIMPADAVRPTGASYVLVDLDGARKDDRIVFHAEWEPRAVFRFGFLLLDSDGRPEQSYFPETITKQSDLTSTVGHLSEFSRLLVVAANVGYRSSPNRLDASRVRSDPGAGIIMTFYQRRDE